MKLPLILAVILAALLSVQAKVFAQTDLRLELEKAFDAYVSAVAAGDAEQLRRSLPAFVYVRWRNEYISVGKKFPEGIFEEMKSREASDIFDLKKLRHIKTVARGRVAYMMYFGTESSYDSRGKHLVPFIVRALFAQEGGQWKFWEVERTPFEAKDLHVNPAELADRTLAFFSHKHHVLAGTIPPVPREYPTPDYLASIEVAAKNCKVTVKYNNETTSLSYDRVPGVSAGASRSSFGPLIGGLKRGQNAISINVQPLSGDYAKIQKSTEPPYAEIRVVVWVGPHRERVTVFQIETNTFGEVKKEFEVTDEVITKGKK